MGPGVSCLLNGKKKRVEIEISSNIVPEITKPRPCDCKEGRGSAWIGVEEILDHVKTLPVWDRSSALNGVFS